MKRPRLSSRLKVLFVGAVLLPAAFLSVLAIRAINREEVYVEKQFEQTLSAELVHVVGPARSRLLEPCYKQPRVPRRVRPLLGRQELLEELLARPNP